MAVPASYGDRDLSTAALTGVRTLFMVSAAEEHLRASGPGWTVLRDNLYLDFLPLLAGDDGVIRGPAPTDGSRRWHGTTSLPWRRGRGGDGCGDR